MSEPSDLYTVKAPFQGGPLDGQWQGVPEWDREVEVTQRGRTGLYVREYFGPTGRFVWRGWRRDNREVAIAFVHPTKWIPESGLRFDLADLKKNGGREVSLFDLVARELSRRNDPDINPDTLKQLDVEPWLEVVAWFSVEVREQ